MKETTFTNNFIKELLKRYKYTWHVKIHGHSAQRIGLPDNLLCINGKFASIEFKVQRDGRISVKPAQINEFNKIKDAKGISLIIAYDENQNKILFRVNRLNIKLFLNELGKKAKSIRIDWDFQFNDYDTAIDLITVLLGGK